MDVGRRKPSAGGEELGAGVGVGVFLRDNILGRGMIRMKIPAVAVIAMTHVETTGLYGSSKPARLARFSDRPRTTRHVSFG
jgi:hypothetical protein